MSGSLYIAVEGPIGVGKTTLVNRLSEKLQARLVLEVVEENPFLELFYADRERYAFQAQLFFLMSRFRQQQELMQGDLFSPAILADYHLLKDRIFARLTLKDEELALYERVYTSLETHIVQPDVLVYLHTSTDVLLDRIRQRGRSFEADFDPVYLADLCDLYQHYFAHYDQACPLLTVDTTALDYSRTDEALDEVYSQIMEIVSSSDRVDRQAR